jgi:hypothetical protein
MYLVAGMVARNYAGPGVVFSFIIAAVASIFSGKYGALSFTIRPPLFLSKETGIHCMGSLLAGSRACLGFTLLIYRGSPKRRSNCPNKDSVIFLY